MKILKSIVTKKVIMCFYNLGEENFKSSSFRNISKFHNGLFEIHQRFKGHFLKELRVSFKNILLELFSLPAVSIPFSLHENIKSQDSYNLTEGNLLFER